jgi:hypothetical protein
MESVGQMQKGLLAGILGVEWSNPDTRARRPRWTVYLLQR